MLLSILLTKLILRTFAVLQDKVWLLLFQFSFFDKNRPIALSRLTGLEIDTDLSHFCNLDRNFTNQSFFAFIAVHGIWIALLLNLEPYGSLDTLWVPSLNSEHFLLKWNCNSTPCFFLNFRSEIIPLSSYFEQYKKT